MFARKHHSVISEYLGMIWDGLANSELHNFDQMVDYFLS